MEIMYIQIITQDMLDWKYMTVLDKRKLNEKEQNYHKNDV